MNAPVPDAEVRRVLALTPADVDAAFSHAFNRLNLGDNDTAARWYTRVLSIAPDAVAAAANLASLLLASRRAIAAFVHLRRGIALAPGYLPLVGTLGLAANETGNPRAAIRFFRRILALAGNHGPTQLNLGVAQRAAGDIEAAGASYASAIRADPGFSLAHYNLGLVRYEFNRFDEAARAYRTAIAIDPTYALAHNNLGNTLRNTGSLDRAAAAFDRALCSDPGQIDVARNRVAAGLYTQRPADAHARDAAAFVRRFAPTASIHDIQVDADPDRRLRLAVLSADLCEHPVGRNLRPLFDFLDRRRIELSVYSVGQRIDRRTELFQRLADRWHTVVGLSDREIAETIRSHQVDILLVTAGWFDENRPLVAAHRAAPVQVAYLDGGTTGLDSIDAWLTDPVLHPEDTTEPFVETLLRLPVLYSYPPPDMPSPSEPGAPNRPINFGSFNNPAKMTIGTIECWAAVLRRIPASRLTLKYHDWYDNLSLRRKMASSFQALGVDPDRVHMPSRLDTNDAHLDAYRGIDIALDTFPFNGATTSFQALSMGVPVVTLLGNTFVSRMTASLLAPLDLSDLVAKDQEAYVEIARGLASDRDRLSRLRRDLPRRIAGSTLCDGRAYAGHFEDAMRRLWRAWCHRRRSA